MSNTPPKTQQQSAAEVDAYQAELATLIKRLESSERSGPAVPLDIKAILAEIEQELQRDGK